jgi:uncharacterized protein (TIGR00369 family)
VSDHISEDLARAAAAGEDGALDAYLTMLKNRIGVRRVHFGSHMGIETLEVRPDSVTMRMPFREELRRGGGIFHGGAIMALADQVAGCLFNTDPRAAASGETGLTTDFNASFLQPADRGEAIVGTGTVLRRGRKVTFMQIEVRGETSRRLVATCRTTYMTVRRADVGKRAKVEK